MFSDSGGHNLTRIQEAEASVCPSAEVEKAYNDLSPVPKVAHTTETQRPFGTLLSPPAMWFPCGHVVSTRSQEVLCQRNRVLGDGSREDTVGHNRGMHLTPLIVTYGDGICGHENRRRCGEDRCAIRQLIVQRLFATIILRGIRPPTQCL